MGMPSQHKRLGWKHNSTPLIVVFPIQHTTPSEVTPYRLTPPVASGRPLTGLGRMRGRGSGSHLMRAFAGSKPLLDRTPYCLCASGAQTLILGDGGLTGAACSQKARAAPTPHSALAPYCTPLP